GAIRGVNRRVPQGLGYSSASCLNVRIVLDAASALDFAALHSNPLPSVGIRRFLYANQIEKPEYRCDKKSEPSIPSLRARGQSRVHQHKWNATRVTFGGKIGPNLRLTQNNSHRTTHRKRTSHDRPVIEWRVNNLHPSRSVLICNDESSGGCRAQNAVQIRLGRAQRAS